MSGGPKTTWRCPDCGHEWSWQTTNGAQFGVTMVATGCPGGCSGKPAIVALDDLRVDEAAK